MRKYKFPHYLVLFAFLILILHSFNCTEKYQPQESIFSAEAESSCQYCHLNEALLKEVATPLPPPSGESGEG